MISRLVENDKKSLPVWPPKLFNPLVRRKEGYKDILESDESFSVLKTSLKSIIADEPVRMRIEDAVIRTNRIMTAMYHFLKLYLLQYPEEVLDEQRLK